MALIPSHSPSRSRINSSWFQRFLITITCCIICKPFITAKGRLQTDDSCVCDFTSFTNASHTMLAVREDINARQNKKKYDVVNQDASRLRHRSLSLWLKLLAFNVDHKTLQIDGPGWLRRGFCYSQNASCWDYCIPMTGDMSRQNCSLATKYELFRPVPDAGHCHASALHLILDDTVSIMDALGMKPMLVAGTLLGAYRNGTIIRWTRDVDIMYNQSTFEINKEQLTVELMKMGYNLFFEGIWRVCINSKHPLAEQIYHSARCKSALPGYRATDVPYMDLYHYKAGKRDMIDIQAHRASMKYTDVLPHSHVELLGKQYKTLARPEAYFKSIPYMNYMSEQNLGYR